ncbi:MAG TPA: C1 family peptidase [Polyangia bacterium]|nr:C1 family peptidase [Polyangia bacterium]
MELDDAWLVRAAESARATLERDGVDLKKVHRRGFKPVARNPAILARHDRRYARALPFGAVENQQSSGRCWLFAPMVVMKSLALRTRAIAREGGFSETYLHFFNMIEKTHAALCRMSAALRRREPLHPDTLRRHLEQDVSGLRDGGEWEWAFELIDKYGVVPSRRMPETASSLHTAELLVELHERLARAARAMMKRGAAHDAIRERALADVVRMLVAHLGAPPPTVSHRGRALAPRDYAREVLGFHAREWRVVISNPRLDAGAVYRKRASDFTGGRGRRFFDLARLNVTMARFRELVRRSIELGFAVGFSGDVGRNDIDLRSGIMHPQIFDRARVYGRSPIRDLPRREDIFLGVAAANHAMAIVGFDVADRADLSSPIVKFRVVNSWGGSSGDHGVFHMYAPWHEENVFKIAVHERVLSPRERDAWAHPVRKLPGGDFF